VHVTLISPLFTLRYEKKIPSRSRRSCHHEIQSTHHHTVKMAKKRKASSRSKEEEIVSGFEERGGKHRAITTYEDVADSEDEFHINRDKVLLDEEPDAKRRRKYAEEGREMLQVCMLRRLLITINCRCRTPILGRRNPRILQRIFRRRRRAKSLKT
jgi:hypothetical protein